MSGGTIDRYDTDDDGQLSRDEFPGTDERFDHLDANDDGYITPDELHLTTTEAIRPQMTSVSGSVGGPDRRVD